MRYNRRCKNGHLKQKISQPSAAALGFQSFVLYRLMIVRGKMREFFCTDLLCFPSYLCVQIYCVYPSTFLYRFSVLFPSTFLYRFTMLSQLPLCTDLLCSPIYLSVHIHCVSPATFLYSVIPQSMFPTYSYLYKNSYSF